MIGDNLDEVNSAILEGIHVDRVVEWARRLNKEQLLVRIKDNYMIHMIMHMFHKS